MVASVKRRQIGKKPLLENGNGEFAIKNGVSLGLHFR